MIRQSWVDWTCPTHDQPLAVEPAALRCPRGESFPVRDGVARFVPDSGYAGPFGHQWNRFRLTQLDSRSGLPITEQRLRRILGEEIWASLSEWTVLEAGCGAGRFTEILLARGARVVSLDLSGAVDANAESFPPSAHHAIAQADVLDMPVANDRFDLVLGLGMVQHTPSPERTIEELYRRVRSGGWLAIDHYPHSIRRLRLGAVLRARYKRLSPQESMRRIERMVDRLLPLNRRLAPHPLAHRLLTRVSPVLDHYRSLPDLPDDLQRDWALLDTYDSLTDMHKHLRTARAIRKTLFRLGAYPVETWHGGNGIEARARKPLSM